MIIIWKADYEGEDIKTDLKKLHAIQSDIGKKIGVKIDGPYFPQDASVLYIFKMEEYEMLNRAGRIFYAEMAKSKLAFVAKSYEVCVTPKEFFGP
jgi:hypothetical protein